MQKGEAVETGESMRNQTVNENVEAQQDEDEGEYCETTQRIVIISPHPVSLNSLVLELTAQCYDVMVFHRADDPMVGQFRGDLLMIDIRRDAGNGAKTQPVLEKNQRVLWLVKESSDEDASSLVWPSPVERVLAAIRGFSEQSGKPSFGSNQMVHKDVVLNPKRMTVHRNGSRVELTKTEFDLLRILLEAGGTVLNRQEMMDLLWGDQYFGGSNTVDAHIKSLRQKLGDDPKKPQVIATVRGVGYRLAD